VNRSTTSGIVDDLRRKEKNPSVRRAVLLCAAALVLTLAGCDSARHVHAVAPSDLSAIGGPAPPLPATGWHEDNVDDPTTFSLAYLRAHSETPDEKAALPVLEQAGFERGYQKAWIADVATSGTSAQVILFRFRDSSGTSDVLTAFRRIIDESFAEERSRPTHIDASGLGEDAFGIHAVSGGHEVVYAWRSANVVAAVEMICFECDSAGRVRRLGRAYADAVDDRVEQASR
jgi:hypothetical protein